MQPTTPPPSGWPRFASAAVYRDAAKAIDWLCSAFGFEVRLKVDGPNGRVEHCELVYGDGLIMIAQETPDAPRAWKRSLRSPQSLGGATTQSLMFYVDDVDSHCAHARSHGATVIEDLNTQDYGKDYWSDRSYGALDLEGHVWWISQRLRNPPLA